MIWLIPLTITFFYFLPFAYAQEKSTPFAEAISSNGVQAIIGEVPSLNHTYLVIAIPTKYLLYKEETWKTIAQNWANMHPTRAVGQIPTIEEPYLSVLCDRENDQGALYQLIQKIQNAEWKNKNEKINVLQPTFKWFQKREQQFSEPPSENDLVVGVLSNSSIEVSWRWVENNTSQWKTKKLLYRENQLDTNANYWAIHRFGEVVDVILFQPILNQRTARILANEIKTENLQSFFYNQFLVANIKVISIQANIFPPHEPMYFWIKITGSSNEFQSYLSNWNVIWQEYLLNNSTVQQAKRSEQLLTQYEELEQKCLQKVYAKFYSGRLRDYSISELMQNLRDENWSILAFVDTTRVQLEEYFQIRKE